MIPDNIVYIIIILKSDLNKDMNNIDILNYRISEKNVYENSIKDIMGTNMFIECIQRNNCTQSYGTKININTKW
jgi:hypothetical protein